MTKEQRLEIEACIHFYNSKRWDWGNVIEFLCRKFNGTLTPLVIRTMIGTGVGRPRKSGVRKSAS